MKHIDYKRATILLILISATFRLVLAFLAELGPNETYYWSFALFPEINNFNQPPMIGWFIQLFTNNLAFDSNFFIRFSSIVSGSATLWIVFISARRVKDESAGFYAVLLYSLSFYFNLFSGTLALPESPQTLFYMLTLYFLLEGLVPRREGCGEWGVICTMALIMAGLFSGLAVLSKLSSVSIWIGALIFITMYRKELYRRVETYVALSVPLLSLLFFLMWNRGYGYSVADNINGLIDISLASGLNLKRVIIAVVALWFLSNPFNLSIIYTSVKTYKRQMYIGLPYYRLLLCLSLPAIVISLVLTAIPGRFISSASLAVTPLFILAGAYVSTLDFNQRAIFKPGVIRKSFLTFITVITVAVTHLFTGFLNPALYGLNSPDISRYDVSLDMYGFNELSHQFRKVRDLDIASGRISGHSYIIAFDYKTASRLDYYIARPNNTVVKTWGPAIKTRKYNYITKKLGGLKRGESVYYIASSLNDDSGLEFGKANFMTVELADTIDITRMGKTVVTFKVYRFKNMINTP